MHATRGASLCGTLRLRASFALALPVLPGRSGLYGAFTPQDFAATVERGRGTFLFTAPAHGTALLGAGLFDEHDFSSVRFDIFAGATCGEELMRNIDAKLPNGRVGQLWGMTELQAGAFTVPGDPVEVPARTAGPASPGNEVRVVGEDGEVLAPGEEGELQVRGCSIFPGYYDNDAANEAAFAEGGWFRSGDLATLDEEGRVRLTGRIKDLINRGGMKYNPADVEELLNARPDIAQAAIVPMPDPQLGERACAFVVPAPGAKVTLEAICDHLAEKRIAKIKWPERLEIVDEMPVTPTRKVIKGILAARLR